jgi:hypothetical protein
LFKTIKVIEVSYIEGIKLVIDVGVTNFDMTFVNSCVLGRTNLNPNQIW